MVYVMIGLAFVVVIIWATFWQLRCYELNRQLSADHEGYLEIVNELKAELAKSQEINASLEKYQHIPDVIRKIDRMKKKAADRMQAAQITAEEILRNAEEEAEIARVSKMKLIKAELEKSEHLIIANQDFVRTFVASAQEKANSILESAKAESRSILSESRKTTSEKTRKIDEMFDLANVYVRDIRHKADLEAEVIAGKAYEALKRYEFYAQARKALKIEVDRHLVKHMFENVSQLDDWVVEFGFTEAGQMLKFARQRTRKLIERDMAGDSQYDVPLKRQFAIHFLIDAFDGKVETLLSRVKPDNFEKLKQELIDAFTIINANGRAFEHTRISDEYRDSRIDELKWACVIQKIRASNRDEQRAIRERIRDEERAKKEYEKALKQAKRDEEMLEKALAKVRRQFENAAADDRAAYLEKIGELEAKLIETEGYIRRTQSLAELTKQGHVYVISNVGSFGENVYKIGLTRRLNPEDRVTELGDASVPFRFDIHACIWAEDAPALEYTLHKSFLDKQLNKMNKRKEFFKVSIQEIRDIVESMGIETKWTLEAMAAEYRESLALEMAMNDNPDLRKQWVDDQLKFDPKAAFDEDEQTLEEEDNSTH